MNKHLFGQSPRILFRYVLLVCLTVLYVICPFFLSARDISFCILTPFIDAEEKNLVLFDYYVYGTEQRFDEGMEKRVPQIKDKLKERNEAVIVKVPGNNVRRIYADYSVVFDQTVPELNIEIYVAKNVTFKNMSVPFVTAETLLERYLERFFKWFFVFMLAADAILCLEDRLKRIYGMRMH